MLFRAFVRFIILCFDDGTLWFPHGRFVGQLVESEGSTGYVEGRATIAEADNASRLCGLRGGRLILEGQFCETLPVTIRHLRNFASCTG